MSDCYWNEYKLCFHLTVHLKNILVSTKWSQTFRKFRGGEPIVDFDAADNCRLYVTTMKAMNFQDDISWILIPNSKDHYVLVFDLTWMQYATENCHFQELVREQPRLELNFTSFR